ncbi:MAG: gliding motility-associated C-terminal domain-containing protein [Salibacteraceae bacterium]
MKEDQSIENLFQETFEHFESDVRPEAWQNIQSRVDAAAAGSSAASSAASGTSLGTIATISAVVLIAASAVAYGLLGEDETTTTPPAVATIVEEPTQSTADVAQETEANKAPVAQLVAASASAAPEVPVIAEIDNETNNSASGKTSAKEVVAAENTPQGENEPAGQDGLDKPLAPITNAGSEFEKEATKEEDIDGEVPQVADDLNAPSKVVLDEVLPAEANIAVMALADSDEQSMQFSNAGQGKSVEWQFGDGNFSTEDAPMHTYTYPGTYEVVLTVTDENGTQAIDRQMVEVKVPEAPQSTSCDFIPNVITPNGDGANDVFKVQCDELAGGFTLTIFSRNGEIVFQSTSIDRPWDARLPNGELAMEGVYFYQITYQNEGKPAAKQGSLQLLR